MCPDITSNSASDRVHATGFLLEVSQNSSIEIHRVTKLKGFPPVHTQFLTTLVYKFVYIKLAAF